MILQQPTTNIFYKLNLKLIFIIVALQVFGLIVLYSASYNNVKLGLEMIFWKQLTWLTIGWVVFFIFTFIQPKLFFKLAYPLYFLNIALLVFTLTEGVSFYGAKRWIKIGIFYLQSSEIMKLSIILALAKLLSTYNIHNSLNFKQLIKPSILLCLPFLLIMKQPDLGTALIILSIGASMLIFFTLEHKVIIITGISVLICIPLAWNFVLKPYQKKRIITFVQPYKDPKGIGYNSIQSQIAIGSGQLIGKGFTKGTQSQLHFIPERHSDFIFSVLSEEFGFWGACLCLLLFFLLFSICLQIAVTSLSGFSSLCIVGIVSFIFWQVFINIGMVTGILPIVGTPLPFFSYGGSSIISISAALGILSSISYHMRIF
ncbi:MAG: rod shape-determining protein RodA [Bdellovibrionaceae bacterium]|nr:rod shape-determining protein RodA [Pseudobdellovibrionaceae bacterium]